MIGIYKFTNDLNGKIYVGQSTQLEKRYNQHKNNHLNKATQDYDTKFYRALRKYGFENFSYKIIETMDEYDKQYLNEREIYWISYYNSYENGYNSNRGGEKVTERGEEHPMAKLTNSQVLEIKEILKNTKITQYDLASRYDVTQTIISEINNGKLWGFLGNYTYPIRKQGTMRAGEKNPKAIFTDEEVMTIRKRYVNETIGQIYKDYVDKCSQTTIDRILRGVNYTYLPYYKKKEKRWIEPK